MYIHLRMHLSIDRRGRRQFASSPHILHTSLKLVTSVIQQTQRMRGPTYYKTLLLLQKLAVFQ